MTRRACPLRSRVPHATLHFSSSSRRAPLRGAGRTLRSRRLRRALLAVWDSRAVAVCSAPLPRCRCWPLALQPRRGHHRRHPPLEPRASSRAFSPRLRERASWCQRRRRRRWRWQWCHRSCAFSTSRMRTRKALAVELALALALGLAPAPAGAAAEVFIPLQRLRKLPLSNAPCPYSAALRRHGTLLFSYRTATMQRLLRLSYSSSEALFVHNQCWRCRKCQHQQWQC